METRFINPYGRKFPKNCQHLVLQRALLSVQISGKPWRGNTKKTVDDNSRTGAEKKTCPFYEEFNELYGNKSETRPSYVMSSSKSESVAIDEINDKAIMDSRCNSGS